MDITVFVEKPLHGSNLIVGGTLGEEAHQLYNEGDGRHMDIGDYIFMIFSYNSCILSCLAKLLHCLVQGFFRVGIPYSFLEILSKEYKRRFLSCIFHYLVLGQALPFRKT